MLGLFCALCPLVVVLCATSVPTVSLWWMLVGQTFTTETQKNTEIAQGIELGMEGGTIRSHAAAGLENVAASLFPDSGSRR